MVRGATFSDDGRHRYTLYRTFEPSNKVPNKGLVLFIMLNPSDADALDDDSTINKCIKFARSWGFRKLKVVNLFAWRARYPKDVANAQADDQDTIGPDNDEIIAESIGEAEMVVCAWGNGDPLKRGLFKERVMVVRRILIESRKPLHVLAMTENGQPGHPLYLADDTVPQLWDPTL